MAKCKLGTEPVDWVIQKKDVEEVYKTLLAETESSGEFKFYPNGASKMSAKAIGTDDIVKGESDSVMTPMGIATYHTHPYDCYTQEQVIWGWPSGEDISQVLMWALSGNLIHVVFAVEGPYVLEVNPCCVVFMKGLSNRLRGAFIHWIMRIGQSTHDLRSHDVNQGLVDSGQHISPRDWIQFVNGLAINNNNATCGLISCNDVAEFGRKKLVYTKIETYLKKFDKTVEFYPITQSGEYAGPPVKMKPDAFAKEVAQIRQKKHNFVCGNKRSGSQDKKWGTGRIFNCRLEATGTLKRYLARMKKLRKAPEKKALMKTYYDNLAKKEHVEPPALLRVARFPAMSGGCKENSVVKYRESTYEFKASK